jgi:hypothetical protein
MSWDIHHTITSHKIQLMEAGGRDKVMQGGITTTLPYPSQDKDERIRQRYILVLSYKAITQISRRDEKEPKENSNVVYGKREHKVRDQTRPRENIFLPTQSLLALCVKLKIPTINHRLKTTLSYRKVTIMRKTTNHIYSRITRWKRRRLETLITKILL